MAKASQPNVQRERGKLKLAYNFGRIGRIANLCKSNKRRRKEEVREKMKNEWRRKEEVREKMKNEWKMKRCSDGSFHDSDITYSGARSCQLALLFPSRSSFGAYAGVQQCFVSADLDQGRASAGIISRTSSLSQAFDGILNPVNGLVCFYNYNGSVCIYNPGTREITPWMYSTLVKDGDAKRYGIPTYGFGYDPITKEHKVICVYKRKVVACEILTVGHNKWRRIDEVPPSCKFYKHDADVVGRPYNCHRNGTGEVPRFFIFDQANPVCVNGSIYWIYNKIWSVGYNNHGPRVLLAFDVGSEKFRTIRVPNVILNQRCDRLHSAGLLEVDGCVAIAHRMDAHTVKLGIYFDHHNSDSKKNNCISTNWTEETIKLPFCWNKNVAKVRFHGVTGTEHLIVRCVPFTGLAGGPVSLYVYNRKTQFFKKVEISGISINDPSGSLVLPFMKSIYPVSNSGTPTHRLDLESDLSGKLRGVLPLTCTRS